MSTPGDPPVGLTIAGSDSGAGAGLQADIKTMGALGVLATTAVTAVTAQNTAAVREVQYLSPEMVEAQIDAVLDDLPVASVKTGLLGMPAIIAAVGRRAAAGDLPRLVVDPVMVASTGRVFLTEDGIDAYRSHLLPHAVIVTPNLWEAALLAGAEPSGHQDIATMADMARHIHDLGPAWVLVKGGHLPGVEGGDGHQRPEEVADVLFDGREVTILSGSHVNTPNSHGTGCSLSAAIVSHLARGAELPAAVAAAKDYVQRALEGGAAWRLGHGHGPLDHLGWSSRPAPATRTADART